MKFVETTCGAFLPLAEITFARAKDGDPDTIQVNYGDAECRSVWEVDSDVWAEATGSYFVVPAAPGIRLIDAGPYNERLQLRGQVLAWRYDSAWRSLTGLTIDASALFNSDSDNVAYLFPDGHIESNRKHYPSLDIFEHDFNARKARWELEHPAAVAARQEMKRGGT